MEPAPIASANGLKNSRSHPFHPTSASIRLGWESTEQLPEISARTCMYIPTSTPDCLLDPLPPPTYIQPLRATISPWDKKKKKKKKKKTCKRNRFQIGPRNVLPFTALPSLIPYFVQPAEVPQVQHAPAPSIAQFRLHVCYGTQRYLLVSGSCEELPRCPCINFR